MIPKAMPAVAELQIELLKPNRSIQVRPKLRFKEIQLVYLAAHLRQKSKVRTSGKQIIQTKILKVDNSYSKRHHKLKHVIYNVLEPKNKNIT